MSDGYPYLTGYLLAWTRDLLGQLERCEHHDQRPISEDRARFDAIQRVLRTSGWTLNDIRAAVNEAIPA